MTKHVFVGDSRVASKIDASWLGRVPTTIYFHDDQLGSTNFLTNDLQELVAHEEHFPSGEPWVDEFDRRYPMRQMAYLFNGKEFDAATGLYYGARYYDPRQSIWASPDPILDQLEGREQIETQALIKGGMKPGMAAATARIVIQKMKKGVFSRPGFPGANEHAER